MKRVLELGSVLAAILGIVMIASVLGRKQERKPESASPAFAGFPLNQPRQIEIGASDELSGQLTRREYSDQARDWLLATVMSNAGLAPSELNQSLFDLPPVRYEYLRPVGSFEYGDTRSRSIGQGRLVALIPKSDQAGRMDALARIADEARKNTGDKPGAVLVFEYDLSPDNRSAEITRRADVEGASLFSEANGYVEINVASLDDLRRFLSLIDDLTFARIQTDGLRLGGRKVQSHHHHDVALDDVAALWSAQMKLRTKNTEFERFVDQKRREFNGRWHHRSYQYEFERIRLEAERDADIAKVKEEVDTERERLGVVEHTGFSLDPHFVYSKVESELRGGLGSAIVLGSRGQVVTADVESAAEQAGRRKMDAFYALLQKLDPGFARAVVLDLKRNCSYQAARYDGALQGTEVGMVLFYTDLLAKLWALDYMSSSPDRYISDFHSMSHTIVSPIYNREMDVLPSTRLWFGVQARGFALQDEGAPSILLAPVATRLYAASSDSITPGKEVAPNPASAAFLGWWDDHYAEVARFEPEYERLNEIMKWSIVISWLDDKGKLECLSPLTNVRFDTGNWFPAWVSKHPDLRFQNWDRIGFYPRPYAKTESLPLLRSVDNLPMPLMGGVSLAEKEVIEARGAISKDISEIGRRPTLKWSESSENVFRTVEGSEYKFAQSADGYTVDASLNAGTKFRSPDAEVGDLQYSRTIAFENSAVRMEARDAGAAIGELRIERAANSFRVSWQSREFDEATALARKVSTAADPASAIASDSRVAASVETGDSEFLVRLRGSSRWLKLAPERQPTADLAEGWHSRVAPVEQGARAIDLAWYTEDRASAELGGAKYVQISNAASPSGGFRMHVAERPPPGASATDIVASGRRFRAQRDTATGDYYVRWTDLPDDVRGRPELLLAAVGFSGKGDFPPVIESLAARDFRGAADNLAASPVQFKVALEQHYLAGLKHADALLTQGDDGGALRILEEMRAVHGNTPEIALRRAIALTRGSQTRRAVNALDDTLKARLRDRTALFDEINARIKNAASGTERDDLLQLAAFGDWSDLRNSGVFRDGTPVASAEDGRLRVDYRADGKLKGMHVPDLPSGDFPIYVQDTPGLSNLDTPSAIQQALHTGVHGRLPVVLKLGQEDIAHFRPAKIYMPDGKTTLRNVEKAASNGANQYYRAYSNQPCSDRDTRPECSDQSKSVYVVVDPQSAAQFN